MATVLDEILDVMDAYDKSEDDIIYVGTTDGVFGISWEEFKEIVEDMECRYGILNHYTEFIIVAKDWVIVQEYDGGYYQYDWRLIEIPTSLEDARPFSDLQEIDDYYSEKYIEELKKEKG